MDFRLAAPRSWRSARSIFLALLAFVTCAPLRNVARASAISLSTQADFETRDEDTPRFASSTTRAAAYRRQTNDAPPTGELGALEPEGPEDDATLSLPDVDHAARAAPIGAFPGQTLRVALVGWRARFWLSCALPRGPPLQTRL